MKKENSKNIKKLNLVYRREKLSIDISKQPKPIDKEIAVNPSLDYHLILNRDGIIEYANDNLCELLDYEEYTIIGESSDVLTHPDTPEILFKKFLESLNSKDSFTQFSKIISNNGSFLWFLAKYDKRIDPKTGIVTYKVQGTKVNEKARKAISNFYKYLYKIEKKSGNTKASSKYFESFLNNLNMTYEEYVKSLYSYPTTRAPEKQYKQSVKQEKIIKKKPTKFDYDPVMDMYL